MPEHKLSNDVKIIPKVTKPADQTKTSENVISSNFQGFITCSYQSNKTLPILKNVHKTIVNIYKMGNKGAFF